MLTFVQGDTGPILRGTIVDTETSEAVNLTSCTVKIRMRRADDRIFQVDADAEVTVPLEGKVAYEWEANDLSVTGIFQVRWRVVFSDGNVIHTATADILVERP